MLSSLWSIDDDRGPVVHLGVAETPRDYIHVSIIKTDTQPAVLPSTRTRTCGSRVTEAREIDPATSGGSERTQYRIAAHGMVSAKEKGLRIDHRQRQSPRLSAQAVLLLQGSG